METDNKKAKMEACQSFLHGMLAYNLISWEQLMSDFGLYETLAGMIYLATGAEVNEITDLIARAHLSEKG